MTNPPPPFEPTPPQAPTPPAGPPAAPAPPAGPGQAPYPQPGQPPYGYAGQGQPGQAPYGYAGQGQPGQAPYGYAGQGQPGPAYPNHAPSGQAPSGQAYPGRPGVGAPQNPLAGQVRRNRAGLVAVILVAVIMVLQTISSFLGGTILRGSTGSIQAYAAFTGATVIIQGLLAVAAIILGAIGLAARDRPRALAGIGLGGGVVVLWSILSGQLSNLVMYGFGG